MKDVKIPNDIFKKNKKKYQTIPQNIFAGTNDSVPDKIHIYFYDKIDIVKIDSVIRYKYKILKKKIPELKEEILERQEKLKKKKTKSMIIFLQKEIKNLEDDIKDYTEDISINNYISESKFFLENEETLTLEQKKKYIFIADKYINIELLKKNKNSLNCKICNYNLEDTIEEDENIYICPKCNCCNNFLTPINYTKDIDYGKTIDEDVINFSKVLDKFEGKNDIHLENNFFQKLDDYFVSKDMQKGIYYKDLSLDEEGKKEGTSKKLLFEALEHLNYSQYYDETNYITNVYWGWELPDISGIRDKIIKDYQNTQKVWNRIKYKYKRSASLGTQYRLFVHLNSNGYICKKEDFKIQDMVESLRIHNDAWSTMCKECGISFYNVEP